MAALYFPNRVKTFDVLLIAEIILFEKVVNLTAVAGVAARNHCKDVEALPFDQHWLISLLAPRYVYVASAIEDTWADPQSELASCIAATPAFEALGVPGLIGDPENSFAGLTLHDGHIGYHCRSGRHYFSREDWQKLVAYMKKHLN